MSEVFSDEPITTAASKAITAAPTTTEDLESHGIATDDVNLGKDVYTVDEESEFVVPEPTADNNNNKEMTHMDSTPSNTTNADNHNTTSANTATTTKKGTTTQSFFHYTNLVTLTIVISMIVAGIYGILDASGVFDDDSDNGSPSQQQKDDNLSNNDNGDNVILDVCSLDGDAFDIRGDGSLLLRQFINTGDDTVTVQLEYNDIGWIAMAFSESTSMIPNTAMLALPDENTVQKFSLSSKSLSGVVPLDSSLQTLTDATVVQEDGRTTMTFTKKLVESDEVEVIQNGTNNFNWAIGSSNTLAFHADRGSATLKFDLCLEQNGGNNANAPVSTITTTAPTAAPTASPTFATTPAPVGYGY